MEKFGSPQRPDRSNYLLLASAILADMSNMPQFFLPPLADLADLAHRALLDDCVPPVPDLVGKICVLHCDVPSIQSESDTPGGSGNWNNSGDWNDSGAECRTTGNRPESQLLAVGDLNEPGQWLQILDDLPDSAHYPHQSFGVTYVTAWGELDRIGDVESDVEAIVRASLSVLESQPLPLLGAVMSCHGGHEWIPACGAGTPGWRVHSLDMPGVADTRTSEAVGHLVPSPRDWWRAAQKVAQPHRRWVPDVWAAWKTFLQVPAASDVDGSDEAAVPAGRLFESWDAGGTLSAEVDVSPADLAMMLAGLQDPALRDGVLLAGAVLGDHDRAAMLDDLVVAGHADELAVHLGEIFRGSQAPSWQHVEHSIERVVGICSGVPSRFAARGLAMVSWWYWFAGRMTRAHHWAVRAGEADSSVRLARLVVQACASQVGPGWLRNGCAAS